MTFEDILAALKSATDKPPRDALAAAVPHADQLAPEVYARATKMCRGVHLIPRDANVLYFGLHILAAARHADLWQHLIALARLKEGELDDLFPGQADITLAQMMLSAWDGDVDAIFRMIEHADMAVEAKWALFDLLTRLTFDGRIPRERTTAFLERYEQENLADADDIVWWGWEGAVTRLGILSLEPALQRVWTKPASKDRTADERKIQLQELHRAAAEPGDPCVLDACGLHPIASATDVADALDAQMAALADTLPAPDPAGAAADDDPAAAIRLTPFERSWLEGFLESRQAPSGAMMVETIDGFFTALALGPVMPAQDLIQAEMWGSDDEKPACDDEEQAAFVAGLIDRIMKSIMIRRDAGALHLPQIEPDDPDNAGSEWADGFLVGVDLGEDAWEPMWKDPRGEDYLFAIEALVDGGTEEGVPPLTRKQRAQTLERLPSMLRQIAAFWKSPDRRFKGAAPVRVEKIGRNDPCPCGSGQKYKKCCALKPPPVIH